MGVYGRSRGVWRITIETGRDPQTGHRKRFYKDFRGSKKEALAEQARMLHERNSGTFVAPQKESVAEFLERWLGYMHDRLAPSAYLSYSLIVHKRWQPTIGSLPIQQLATAHIIGIESRWLASGRAKPSKSGARATPGLSRKTVLNYHRVLVEALNYAVRWRVVATNIADDQHMEPPKAQRAEIHSLGLDDVQKLLYVLEQERHGAAIYTLLATGLRVGEVVGLRWRDIDLTHGQIQVQQQYDRVLKDFRDVKSHRSKRPVAIDPVLIDLLRQHQAEQDGRRLAAKALWRDTGLVFTNDVGEAVNHEVLRNALDHSLAAAGLVHVTLHSLRHTHASLLIQLGTNLKIIQERLGHASFAITADIYSHVAPGLQREAADLLGRALKGG